MENFTFWSPTLFAFGDGKEREIGALVRRFGGTRVLLVTGGEGARRSGALADAADALRASDIPFTVLPGVQPNPRSGKVREGIALGKREGVDFLLAVGGGSVIDTAKSIGIGLLYDGDFWDFFAGRAQVERTVPVGAVPTLAAAGSEGSDSAVITNEELGLKWGIPRTDRIRPVFAVLNPRYTVSLPSYQTACGAVDIIAHVLERYFTNTPDAALTDRLCEAIVKTVLESAPRALQNPGDYAARAELMWSGTLAHNNLCGVGRVQDWASHQIGHELSAYNDCAHGASLAVVLPAWMEFTLSHDVERFAQLAVRVLECEPDAAAPERTAREGIARLRSAFAAWGMPATLQELKIPQKAIPGFVENRARKPGGFPFGNFVKIGPTEMEAILRLTTREA